MNPRFAGLIGGLLLLSTTSLQAQEPITIQLYGTGVHCYFSGDYRKAHELLSSAIASGSKDPRAYYFRGLCYLRLGREVEAKQDFDEGARLETAELDRGFNISRAFERVQGPDRAVLEQYRVKLRLAAFQREQKLRQDRYEKLRRDEKRVLEQQAGPMPSAPGAASGPLANPLDDVKKAKPGAADQVSGEKESSADPLSDFGAEKEKKPAAAAAKKDAKAMDDPFADSGDEKKPAAKKDTKAMDDPFADSGDEKKPAAKKPAAKAEDDDPFANAGGMSDNKAAKKPDKKDDADPFADSGDDKKPAAKKPAAKADDDPFASDAGEEKPAKKAPAPAKKAPAASKKAAKKGADGDGGDEPAPKKGAKKAAR